MTRAPLDDEYDGVPELPPSDLTLGFVAFAVITMGALTAAIWWPSEYAAGRVTDQQSSSRGPQRLRQLPGNQTIGCRGFLQNSAAGGSSRPWTTEPGQCRLRFPGNQNGEKR